MAIHVDADVGHGVLAGVGQGHLLDEGEQRLEDEDDQQGHGDAVQVGEVLVDEDEINKVAHDQRQHQAQQRTDDQGEDGHGHPAPIGPDVA